MKAWTKKNNARENPKLKDVARLANVSTATVSRALTKPEHVGNDTLERIQAAVRTLRYVPHGAARALRSKRTRTIGAIVPTLGNAIFADYTQSLQKALESRGYRMLLACNEYDPLSEEALVAPLIEHGIDGLVLVGYEHPVKLFQVIENARLPYVLTWTMGDDSGRPSIGFSNRDAATRVTEFLLDMRHRRFAMIAGITRGNDRARERVDGVITTLGTRGIELDKEHLMECPYTFADGREAMRRLMSLRPQPTAVICGNDVIAIGALAECHAMHIDVPAMVSITGFDDMDMSSITTPALTTIRVPAKKLGHLAAQYIVERVEGLNVSVATVLEVDLIVRGTTGPAA